MKTFALCVAALVLCLCADAATPITVSDTIYLPNGTPASGTLSVRPNMQWVTNDGVYVVLDPPKTATITNGLVTMSLIANGDAAPQYGNTYYRATYQLSDGSSYTETWVIPHSTTPVHIRDIVSNILAPAQTKSLYLPLQQITRSNAVNGDVPVFNESTNQWIAESIPSAQGSAYTLPVGSTTVLGGVKQGANTLIAGDGTLTVPSTAFDAFGAAAGITLSGLGGVTSSQAAAAAPVQSVNGQTGIVSLTIPTVPSDLGGFTNGPGFITSAQAAAASPIQSFNSRTGAIVPQSADYSAFYDAAGAAAAVRSSSLQSASNLSDVSSVAVARGNLGLSTVAATGSYTDLLNKPSLPSVGTTTGTYAAGNDVRITGALQANSNLSDVTSPGIARANLGISVVGNTGAYTDLSGRPGIFVGSGPSHVSGLVPDPGSTAGTSRYLREDGTWSGLTTTTVWGGISGTLSNQTDLNTALAGKQANLGFTPESTAKKGVVNGYAPLDASALVPVLNLPTIPYSKLSGTPVAFGGSGVSHSTGLVPDPGAIAGTTRYLREDGTWSLVAGSGGAGTWGSITGTLTDQTDLAAALAGKQASLGFTAENAANKGGVNGYAPLDASSLVPLGNVPTIPNTQVSGLGSASTQDTSAFEVPLTFNGGLTRTVNTIALTNPIPTQTSQLTNNSGFITGIAWGAITGTLASQTDLSTALAGKQASLGFTAENAAKKGAASGYAPLDTGSLVPLLNLPTIPASQTSGFATVATSGSYTDLSNKPTITAGTVTHTAGALTLGQLLVGNASADLKTGDLSGDVTTAGSTVTTVAKVNGTSVPTNAAADTVLLTTGIGTASWAAIADCHGANQAVNYNTTTHALGCATISASGTGTVTSVDMTLPAWLTVSGNPITTAGTLAVTATTGQTQNQVLATPNGAAGAVGLRSLVAADLPSSITSNTSGTAANITGVAGIANGGTGQATAAAGFNALSPITLLGDLMYGSAANTVSRLAGNTTASKNLLCQTGTGTVSAAPSWCTLASGDIPANAANTTGTAANVTGTVAIANGGTGQTSASAALTALGGQAALGFTPENSANKGAVSGYAPLNASSVVPLANLPTIPSTQTSGFAAVATSGSYADLSGKPTFNSLSPITTLGDVIYGSGANAAARLAGNTTATRNLLCQTGTGTVSAAPAWCLLASGDIPNNAANTTGTAANVTGTVAIANGGTNAVTAAAGFNNLSPLTTAGDVLYGGTAGAGTRLAAGTSTQVLHSGTTPSWGSVNLAADVSGSLPYASVSGTPAALPPNGAASGDLSGNYPAPVVAKINGTSVPTNAAADQFLGTTAAATGAWASIANCLDSSGQHLNYSTTTHSFSCGTTSGSMVYPGAGIPVSTGSAWGSSVTAPAGAIVGTTDTQTLTNKSIASTEITGLPTFPSGTIVGTTDTQTLTNKSIAGSEINSGTVGISSGGSGQATAAAAFNAFSPMTTLGDVEYESAANTASRLAGNTTATKKFLSQTGTGTVSAAPGWNAIVSGDVPPINLASTSNGGVTGSLPYASLTGTPTIPTTGTGLTSTGGVFSVNYGTSSTTATVGNDSRVVNATQDPGSNGFTSRTAANTLAARTFQSSANSGITWTNGDGVAGNPVPVVVIQHRNVFRAGVCQGTNAFSSFSMAATNAPTANCVTGTNTIYGVLTFTATGQNIQDHFKLPSHWTGAIDLDVVYRSASTTGNIVWNIATACVADGAVGDPSFNTAQTVSTAAQGTTQQWKTASLTGITATGCAANSEFMFKLGLDASSTTTGNIDLIDIGLTARDAK